jgi:hypothetical protein
MDFEIPAEIAAYLRDGTTPPRRTGTRSDLVCSPVPPAEP